MHVHQLATEAVSADPFKDGTTAYDRGEYAAAAQLLRSPADKGKADAQFLLGDMYSKGDGVPQNLADATKWYHKAADQGLAEAQFRLGFIYVEGLGVPQDYAEGVSWYLRLPTKAMPMLKSGLDIFTATARGLRRIMLRR